MRNIKSCLENIFNKINLYRLINKEIDLFDNIKVIKIEFPFIVTKEIIDSLIKKNNEKNENWKLMYL